MSIRRKRFVERIFDQMDDEEQSGFLTIADLKANFQPQNDPRVNDRIMSPEAVAQEFAATF